MHFKNITFHPADPIFGVQKKFVQDSRRNKKALVIGYYQDSKGKTSIMRCVQESQKEYFKNQNRQIKYLPMKGHELFIDSIKEIIFGDQKDPFLGVQSLGGTGALYLGSKFLKENGFENITLSNPTWANHRPVFEFIGMKVATYPYFDVKSCQLQFPSMKVCLQRLTSGTTVLLHPSCHNPTGCNLTKEQWKELSEVILKKKLIVFFDLAYQGLGKGIEEDVWPIRYFAKQGHKMMVAITCSKNFSLYCQRIGALFIRVNKENQQAIQSQFDFIIRRIYSNPPEMGAQIIATILSDKSLKKLWEKELAEMRQHILNNRRALKEFLEKNLDRNFENITTQEGLFSYIGLTNEHVEKLEKDHAIYLPKSGRLNISALNKNNMNEILQSLVEVMH